MPVTGGYVKGLPRKKSARTTECGSLLPPGQASLLASVHLSGLSCTAPGPGGQARPASGGGKPPHSTECGSLLPPGQASLLASVHLSGL
ncbi:MAG: hypothetical protein DVB26_09200, partial [Verrucomicrobia bacterium]